METNDPFPGHPAAQLAALRADRLRMAERVRPPWWYDPVLALFVFLVVGSIALRGIGWWQPAIDVLAVAGLWAAVAGYRRATGVWVSGTRRGRTRRAIYVWVGVYVTVVVLSLAADVALGWRWATVVGGAVLAVGAFFISRWWTRLFAAEMREDG